MQFLLSGVTVGAVYALVALGFTIIYNASDVVNFAQGEFVMLGGMATVSLLGAGLPLAFAAALAIALAALVGLALARFAVQPARGASVVSLLVRTSGASILVRGLASLVWDKRIHALPAFTGEAPIAVAGASLAPQSLWVIGVTALIVCALWAFFNRTLAGKAILAVSHNRLAAQLMGISVRRVLLTAFALSAALGALAGILVAPITFTSWDVGVMLGLKGFAAAILGGLGSGPGAVVGGLVLGLLESLGAGYISSAYKDAIAFIVMLAVLMLMPGGLLGGRAAERV
jgi:branched-chain amino acid transport system permease protein